MRELRLPLTVLLATIPALGCSTPAPTHPRHVLVPSGSGSSFFYASRGQVVHYSGPEAPPSSPLGNLAEGASISADATRYSAHSTEGGTFLLASDSDITRVHPTGELHRVGRSSGSLPSFLSVRGRLAFELDGARMRIRRARDLEVLYRFSPSRWLESRGHGRFMGICPPISNQDAESHLQILVAGQESTPDGDPRPTVEFWELELPTGMLEEAPPTAPPLWTPRRLGMNSGFEIHACVGSEATLWGAGSALRMPSLPTRASESGEEDEPEPELRLEVYAWAHSDPNGSQSFSLPWPAALQDQGEPTPLPGIYRVEVHQDRLGLLHHGGTLRVLLLDGTLVRQLEGIEAFAFLATGDLVFVPRTDEDEPLATPRAEPLGTPSE